MCGVGKWAKLRFYVAYHLANLKLSVGLGGGAASSHWQCVFIFGFFFCFFFLFDWVDASKHFACLSLKVAGRICRTVTEPCDRESNK